MPQARPWHARRSGEAPPLGPGRATRPEARPLERERERGEGIGDEIEQRIEGSRAARPKPPGRARHLGQITAEQLEGELAGVVEGQPALFDRGTIVEKRSSCRTMCGLWPRPSPQPHGHPTSAILSAAASLSPSWRRSIRPVTPRRCGACPRDSPAEGHHASSRRTIFVVELRGFVRRGRHHRSQHRAPARSPLRSSLIGDHDRADTGFTEDHTMSFARAMDPSWRRA